MKNDFAHCAKYYDLTQRPAIEKSAKFVSKLLKKHKIKTILELGCGTGLYLGVLKKHFKVEGLDIGKEMLSVAKKLKVPLHKKDMSRFNLKKKFDAVLCLNSSLLYLHNFKQIEKTIKNVVNHLNPNGLFLLDLPNLAVEIPATNNSQEHETFTFPNGKVDIIFRDYKKGNRWCAEWMGFAQEGNKYFNFHDKYCELIYSPKQLEKTLEKYNFKILKIFASRTGAKFNKNKSWRRFYVCQLQ